MAGPAGKTGPMTSKSLGRGPKSVASKPGNPPVVPRPAAKAVAPKAAIPATPRAMAAKIPVATPALSARISVPKGETFTPAPAIPRAPMQPITVAPVNSNAHAYVASMAAAAHGAPARPGFSKPIQPKT